MVSKKLTRWARYQSLLISRPLAMQVVQAGVVGAVGNLIVQLLSGDGVRAAPVIEQVVLNSFFVAPIMTQWLRVLRRMQLHWLTATLVDQFGFVALLNICIFYFLAAGFRGGVVVTLPTTAALADPAAALHMTFSLRRAAFPSLLSYSPIWSTRVKGLYLKLPSTLLREKMVPAHLKGVFELAVSLVWNMILAVVLATT